MTIEEEIRKRLAAEQISPENIEAIMQYVKADPILRSMGNGRWGDDPRKYQLGFNESIWICAWSSARDWIEQQQKA